MRKIPLSAMRKIIAEKMTKSKEEIPHFYLTVEVDMTGCIRERIKLNERLQKQNKPKCSFDDFIIKAVAKSLEKYPHINCLFIDNSLHIMDEFNVGFAVALSFEDGVIVPVVHSADKLPIEEIIIKRDELASKARGKKLSPDELKGAQTIITNLGMYDIKNFIAIIPPTASSILAIAKIEESPVVKDGKVLVRSVMSITGSFDHRAINGACAAIFLQEIKTLLEDPKGLTK